MNRLSHLLVVLGAALLVASVAYAKAPPAEVTLKAKQGNVSFSHKKHADEQKIACKKCHHNIDKEKDKMSCADCHKDAAEGGIPSSKDAFHKSCIACHKEKKAADAATKAPTGCKDCHKK